MKITSGRVRVRYSMACSAVSAASTVISWRSRMRDRKRRADFESSTTKARLADISRLPLPECGKFSGMGADCAHSIDRAGTFFARRTTHERTFVNFFGTCTRRALLGRDWVGSKRELRQFRESRLRRGIGCDGTHERWICPEVDAL